MLEADREVLSVAALAEVVRLVVVFEQPGRFAETPESHEHFDALVPRNGAVVVIVHDQDRRVHVREPEEGRVLHVEFKSAPEVPADAALRLLVLELPAHAGFPADAAVGRCHVGDGGACAGRFEHVGPGNEVSHFVTAPALALDGHVVLVDPRIPGQGLRTAYDTVVGRLAGHAGGIDDVRDEDHVTARSVEGEIDRGPAGLRHHVLAQVLGIGLVEIDHDRVLLVLVEVLRLVQQAVQRSSVVGEPVVQFHGAPVVVLLLGIDGSDTFGGFAEVRDIQVHRVLEISFSIGEDRSVLRLLESAPGVAAEFQGLQDALLAEGVGGQAVLLGRFVENAQIDGLGRADGGIGLAVLGGQVAVGAFLCPAVREFRGLPVGEVHLPDVIAVIQENCVFTVHPGAETVRIRPGRVVVLLVPEDGVDTAGQVDDLFIPDVIGEPVPLLQVPPDGVPAARGKLCAVHGAAGEFHLPAGAQIEDGKGSFVLDIPLGFNGIDRGYLKNYISIVMVPENQAVGFPGTDGNQPFVLVHAGIGAALVPGEVGLHPGRDLIGIPVPDVQSGRLEGDEVRVLDGHILLDAGEDGPVLPAEEVGTVLGQAPVLRHVPALVGLDDLPGFVPVHMVQPEGRVLAAGGGGVQGLEVEGFGAVLIKSGEGMEGGRIRKRPGYSAVVESDDRVLLVRLADECHRFPVLGKPIFVHVLQGVQMAVGKVIDCNGRPHFLLHLLHERGVDGREGELIHCVKSQLEGLDIRILGYPSILEIDDGQGVLRQLVSGEFPDLRAPGLLEFRLDEAHGIGVVVQDLRPVSAGNGDDVGTFLSGDAEIQGAVAFLGIHAVGHDLPGRGQDGTADGLPAVIGVVVQGLFLGPCARTQGNEQEEGNNSFHIVAVIL